MALHGMLHNSLYLVRHGESSGLKKNTEFSQDIRELKFPVTGSSSESLLVFCDLVAKNAPKFPL